MDSQKILNFVIDAGETMLKNGAETTRVEDTMTRILSVYSFKSNDVFAMPTGLFGSVVDEKGNIVTMVRRIATRTINLEKISLVNGLSRRIVAGEITVDNAILQLYMINKKSTYRNVYKYLSSGLTSGCFAFIFGGTLLDSFNAFLTGFLLYVILIFLRHKSLSDVFINILSGAFVSLFAFFLVKLRIGHNVDMAVIGAIMPLVPGVGLTNAIRDIISGEYLSGSIRLVDAVLVAICIATGVGMGLWFGFNVLGEFSLWF